EEPLEPVAGSSLGGGISAVAASAAAAAAPIEVSGSASPLTGSDPLSPSADFVAAASPAPAAELAPPGDNNWVLAAGAPPAPSAPARIESPPPPGGMVRTPDTAAASPASASAPAESRPGPAWLYSPAVEISKNVLAGVGVLAIFGHLLRAIFARK